MAWGSEAPGPRRLWPAGLGLSAVALLLAVEPDGPGFTVCPFALVTGMACPGCGLTRAAAHLVRGDLGTALAYHPLVIPLAIGAVFALVAWWSGRPVPGRAWVDRILWPGVGLFLVTWLVRLGTGALPPV